MPFTPRLKPTTARTSNTGWSAIGPVRRLPTNLFRRNQAASNPGAAWYLSGVITLNIENQILFYGVNWCGDCKRSKRIFSEMQVPYLWYDLDKNSRAVEFVKSVNQGMRRVPTIVFPDGSMLMEPRDEVLRAKCRNFSAERWNTPAYGSRWLPGKSVPPQPPQLMRQLTR